ncbi:MULTISPECIES: DUF6766 family protein [Micromonospora]|uniref:Uncharacterized protein n=1 Tax=Micromonospora solifontis TaxID=2487138 RepID=A0ABX9WHM8_9ACTN|nr:MULTISPECIES: DUF6766 family protein [Micromonospora]NES12429.1 hypothetical protein [Micromonospora sp. PPF5-17B]NES36345.1 hypothetical protein [Micromonospora solifontis]NES57809.1 hypothetical protein [Micromonospora sp. PPF5-6]RNL99586.1 hypothetical protein EFE23_09230 [Micromonospora solifontis]
MSRWLRDNALTVAMLGAFLIFLTLQSVFGWQVHNEELTQYGAAPLSWWAYLGTGHFAEAVFENWESEFLQMGGYVLLTAYLVQKGSAESKPEGQTDRPDDDARRATPDSPWPARVGGLPLAIYRNSLSIALLLIFAGSFLGHLLGGVVEYNQEQALESGAPPISAVQFLGTSDFWFQSMQNWQSEFLAVGVLILLSIVLRQHASPESKPVTAAHAETGA